MKEKLQNTDHDRIPIYRVSKKIYRVSKKTDTFEMQIGHTAFHRRYTVGINGTHGNHLKVYITFLEAFH
mgnify:FL=1